MLTLDLLCSIHTISKPHHKNSNILLLDNNWMLSKEDVAPSSSLYQFTWTLGW